jgi:hypothetical protein
MRRLPSVVILKSICWHSNMQGNEREFQQDRLKRMRGGGAFGERDGYSDVRVRCQQFGMQHPVAVDGIDTWILTASQMASVVSLFLL